MKWKDSIITGLFAGLLGPWIGALLFYLIKSGASNGIYYGSFIDFIKIAYYSNILNQVLALGGFLNLGIFFLFLKLHWNVSAKWVIGATMLYVFALFMLKNF